MKILTNLTILFSLLLAPVTLWAYENLPDGGDMPDVAHLRKDCKGTNPDLKNCADNMQEMLNWVWITRSPTSLSPLLINIGPGDYGTFTCNSSGNVTLRGAGRENTRLTGFTGPKLSVIDIQNCNNMSFQDMTIDGVIAGANIVNSGNLSFRDLSIHSRTTGIEWSGGGNSLYTNVELSAKSEGSSVAWIDNCGSGSDLSEHTFYGSKIVAEGALVATSYYAICSNSWFYGSEILTSSTTGPNNVADNTGIRVKSGSSVHVYGSSVRTLGGSTTGHTEINGIELEGGTFHMHGGIIAASAAGLTQDIDVAAIRLTTSGSTVHVLDTAFNAVASGSGTAYRILDVAGGSDIRSPFQWFSGTTPPQGNPAGSSVRSITGADMYVETDCSSSGCQVTGNETHLMIYNENCSTDGPWFDSTKGKCRGEP